MCTVHEGRGGVQKGCLLWAGWVRWGQPLSAPWPSGMAGFLRELQRSLGAWYPSASFSPGNLRRWGWGEAGNSTGGGGTSPAAPLLLITQGAHTSLCCTPREGWGAAQPGGALTGVPAGDANA